MYSEAILRSLKNLSIKDKQKIFNIQDIIDSRKSLNEKTSKLSELNKAKIELQSALDMKPKSSQNKNNNYIQNIYAKAKKRFLKAKHKNNVSC